MSVDSNARTDDNSPHFGLGTMLRTFVCLAISLLALGRAWTAEDGKDFGIPNWSCDAEVMKKSKTKPTNVHSLRFADIDIIAALGDSLTAGNGAGAEVGDAVAVLIQYRGLPFGIGGDKSLDEHVTLANIMKKFNPDIFGYSTGTGSANVWKTSKLNTAIPGAETSDLVGQAQDLIRRMKDHPEIDFKNQWKMIHIFIGANDICDWCDYPDTVSDQHFRDNIGAAVQLLKDNLPKTIVVLVGMFDLSLLRKIDKDKYFCDKLHAVECPCEQEFDFSDEEISAQCKRYMATEQELMDGRFDTTEDFTLVIQPFFEEINEPPMTPDGEPDLTFFAPDCFHFSAYGHAVVAKALWNNIVQPVGVKDRFANLTDLTPVLSCPDKACPFIRTTLNSADCAKMFRTCMLLCLLSIASLVHTRCTNPNTGVVSTTQKPAPVGFSSTRSPVPVVVSTAIPSTGGTSQCPGGIPAAEVQGFLDAHNALRQSISAGTFVAKGQKMPAAATPIPNLTWDCGIEASAQAVADTCVFEHSTNRVNLGENLYYYESPDGVSFTGQGKAASDDWSAEFQEDGWLSIQFTEAVFDSGVAHATQMAWANSTQIGCGMALCQGGTQVIVDCQYRNQGNIIGENVYNPV